MGYQELHISQAFELENGEILPSLTIGYHTYGQYAKGVKPVVWICHALTANSDAAEWWGGLVGNGKLFDPDKHFIVCANVLGSCYGSTGPLSINPVTGNPYYHSFPLITVRDMIKAHILLRKYLGIPTIDVLIGGSLGGQQVLEWCIVEPTVIQHAVPIATNAFHSAWGKAFNESQRMAIKADKTFKYSDPKAGLEGLKAARSIALLSYRHYNTYANTQSDDKDALNHYKAWSYQQYQGEKLAKRFNAFSYIALLYAMDSHHIARNRGMLEEVLASIQIPLTVIGIDTDILFPIDEQMFIVQHVPNARLFVIESLFGHDGFLIETKKISEILSKQFSNLFQSSDKQIKQLYHEK
ncbi:MAG: homoserine O-acetyltransferase [Flavobacteriales bacterium]|nr:homoserine O-acetyltransferase [Flavobacteriales bacterium]